MKTKLLHGVVAWLFCVFAVSVVSIVPLKLFAATLPVPLSADYQRSQLQAAPGCWNLSTTYTAPGPQGSLKRSASLQGPVPTHKWWSSAIWDTGNQPYSLPLYFHPFAGQAHGNGLQAAYVSTPSIGGDHRSYAYALPAAADQDLLLSVDGLNATGSVVDAFSDWSTTLLWQDANNHILRTTLVKGVPYIYVTLQGGDAVINLPADLGIKTNINVQGSVAQVTVGSQTYGVFAPLSVTWQVTNNNRQLRANLQNHNYYSVAALPDATQATLQTFAAHAFAFVKKTTVSWAYDGASSQVYSYFHFDVDNKEPSLSATPLVALYPHQWRYTDAKLMSYQYASPRGLMKVIEGDFNTVVPFNGVLPALPYVGKFDPNQLAEYVLQSYNNNSISMSDTYSSGSTMGRLTEIVPIADQLIEEGVQTAQITQARDSILALIQSKLTDWFDASSNTPPLFRYHANWGTAVGYPASFGSDNQLNDHHFHWGYLVRAAAMVAFHDRAWAADTQWGGMVKTLIRDAANPLRDDPYFPFLRHFDVYEGHSWASGPAQFAAGNNQESSSEAVNLAVGLIQFGEATDNLTIRNLGVYLYTTETTAIQDDWFNAHQDVFPQGYTPPSVAILWGNGGAYGTWWTAQPEAIHGIEFLPFTGGSLYLGHNPNAMAYNYEQMVKWIGGQEGSGGTPDSWTDPIWMMQALYDPTAARAKFDAQRTTFKIGSGESYPHMLHWIYGLVELGHVETHVFGDIANHAVFNNNGTLTYVAYNHYCDKPRDVHFSDGTHLVIPPRNLLAWRNGKVWAQSAMGGPCTTEKASCTVVAVDPIALTAATPTAPITPTAPTIPIAPATPGVVSLDHDGTVPATAPAIFTTMCAGCHGATGSGNPIYPNITNVHDFTYFTNTVRQGKSSSPNAQIVMPSFDNTWVSDDDLTMIYAYLNQLPVKVSGVYPAPAKVMSDAEIDVAFKEGLAAWRTMRTTNSFFACYNCHGPDPLEFAYVGFTDSDILRRANKHVDVGPAKQIVTMVNAMRQRYKLPQRDPATFRPFQPGGEVLPGNSAAARDLAFAQELQSMGLSFMNKPINSVADAAHAEQEFLQLNLRQLKIGIPFNIWSEDGFHNPPDYKHDCAADIDMCDDHGTIADWVPTAPHLFTNPNNFFAVQDAYLANPNAATFAALMSATGQGAQPGTWTTAYYLDDNKYMSMQIAQHCMRLDALGLPGCDTMGPIPFPNEGHPWNVGGYANLFGTGYSTMGNACNLDYQMNTCGNPPLTQTPSVIENLTPGTPLHEHMQRIRHTWFMMHFLNFDPTSMMTTPDNTSQLDEYFTRSVFLANNDTGDFYNPPTNPTYSIHAVFEIFLRNVELVNLPQVFTCDKFPFYHPDLGHFPCTTPNIESGYFPELANFAEGKSFYNDSNYWDIFMPKDEPRRGLYQLMAGNMYRLFFYKLIGALQINGNTMCQPQIMQLRINRGHTFLSQPEIVAINGPADANMFATLKTLLASTKANVCPPLNK